jgi:putative ABC transport system permease protein
MSIFKLTLKKENSTSKAHSSWSSGLLRDGFLAIRQLRKSLSFTVVAIFIMSLGIGASTSILSVVNAVLFQALPYSNPKQLMRVWEQAADGHQSNVAETNFEDFLEQNRTFSSLAAYNEEDASITAGKDPVRTRVSAVSRNFFPTFGVQPLYGRLVAADDPHLHSEAAAVVSYSYWQHNLASMRDLSNLHLDINGSVYDVVGVMPSSFNYPAGVAAWIPRELHPPPPSRSAHNWRVLGRVRKGVSARQANADLNLIAERIQRQYGSQVSMHSAVVVPLITAIVGDVQAALFTLLGAAGLLLIITTANVIGLLVARTSARQKEVAVRMALGAGRARLLRQFLAESLVLSIISGLIGIIICVAAVKFLPKVLPASLPRLGEISVSVPAFLFAFILTIAIGVALGLFSAWQALRGNVQTALSSHSRTHSSSGRSNRIRSLLVVGEIAATLIILTSAGLLGRSFLRLLSTDPGFQPKNLTTITFSPPVAHTDGARDQRELSSQIELLDTLSARLSNIPGTRDVGLAGALPVAEGDNLAEGLFLSLQSQPPPATFDEFDRLTAIRSRTGHARYAVASPDYFRTLGIPVIQGRTFEKSDSLDSYNVAVISESLARKQWPNNDAIGQVIEFGNMDGNLKPLTVVGVVGDVRAQGLDLVPPSIIYVSYRQRGLTADATPTFLMRSTDQNFAVTARKIFHDVAPGVPVKFSTFEAEIGGWFADRRFLLMLVGAFSVIALTLAAVGLYGVVNLFVILRKQDLGVRIALGAQRGDILNLVLIQGVRLSIYGLIIGVGVSLAIEHLLSSLLFGVTSTDPFTFSTVTALVFSIALVVSYIPAHAAMRINPVVILRQD